MLCLWLFEMCNYNFTNNVKIKNHCGGVYILYFYLLEGGGGGGESLLQVALICNLLYKVCMALKCLELDEK